MAPENLAAGGMKTLMQGGREFLKGRAGGVILFSSSQQEEKFALREAVCLKSHTKDISYHPFL